MSAIREDVEWMRETGESLERAAARLGVQECTLRKWLWKWGITW